MIHTATHNPVIQSQQRNRNGILVSANIVWCCCWFPHVKMRNKRVIEYRNTSLAPRKRVQTQWKIANAENESDGQIKNAE